MNADQTQNMRNPILRTNLLSSFSWAYWYSCCAKAMYHIPLIWSISACAAYYYLYLDRSQKLFLAYENWSTISFWSVPHKLIKKVSTSEFHKVGRHPARSTVFEACLVGTEIGVGICQQNDISPNRWSEADRLERGNCERLAGNQLRRKCDSILGCKKL